MSAFFPLLVFQLSPSLQTCMLVNGITMTHVQRLERLLLVEQLNNCFQFAKYDDIQVV